MHIVKAGTALLQLTPAKISKGLKMRWFGKTFPYGLHYRDERLRFDRLYLVSDPWSLNCERESFRFRETNSLILENFGHLHSLLEIGCGEGLQSSELQGVCDRLQGIDVSRRAVTRAKRRCPQAAFAVGDMYDLPQPALLKHFDLVIACEVLYYMSDVATALKRMSALGQACLVSYYDGHRERLDKHVMEIPGVRFKIVSYENTSWKIAWWRS